MSAAEVIIRMGAVDARTLTDRIKVGVEACWELITQAYVERAWDALGYSSWDDYCTREFGTSRLRLPREERQEVVSSLRESGLSIRAIAAATGDSHETIRRSLPPVTNVTSGEPLDVDEDELAEELIATEPRPIIGTDGKTYQPRPQPVEPPAPRRRALTDVAREIGLDLNKVIDRLERFAADDRLGRNKNEVAPHLRYHLVRAIQVCQGLDDQFDN